MAYISATPCHEPANDADRDGSSSTDPCLRSTEGANLDDDLQDRAGADRQRECRPLRAIGEAPEPHAQDGRGASQQRQADEGDERWASFQQRRGNPNPLGDVVKGEAEDEERAEPGGAGREGGADREALAEIVQTDPEGDVGRERQPGRRAAPAAEAQSRRKLSAAASTTITGPWNAAAASPGEFEGILDGVDKRNASSPIVRARRKLMPSGRARAAPDRTSGRSPPAGCRRTRRPGPAAQAGSTCGLRVGTATGIS